MKTIIGLRNKLKIQNQDLNHALRAKGLFLANMSHELRTPMNGVIGMLSLAHKEPLSHSLQEKLDIAQTSANTLLEIINDILDYSKIEAGKLSLEIIEFNLWHTLEEIAQTFKYQLQSKGLNSYLEIAANVPHWVKLDRVRFSQIINNLMSNAVKFTQEGYIMLAVEWSEPQSMLVIRVRDTGIGIAPENIQKVFSSFTQADESTTREFGGTGLGLSITKHLCELMQGDIKLESQVGEFTQFSVRIPVTYSRTDLQSTFDLAPLPAQHLLIINADKTIQHHLPTCLPLFGVTYSYAQTHGMEPTAAELELLIGEHTPPLNLQERPLIVFICHKGHYCAIRWQHVMASGLILDNHVTDVFPVSPQQLYQLLLPPDPRAHVQVVEDVQPQQHYSQHVLIVDDNKTNLELAGMVLEDLGFQFSLLNGGEKAVTEYYQRNTTIDLILMDCQMPLMDGFEATRLIRKFEQDKQLAPCPILALTANVMPADKERCLQSGMDDFIPKPIDIDFLERKLHQHLKLDSHLSTIEQAPPEPKVDQGSLWDQEEFLAKLRYKHDRANRVIEVFLDSIEQRYADLVSNIDAGQLEEAARLAHGIKGSALNLSLNRLAEYAKHIEEAADTGRVERLEELHPLCQANLIETMHLLQEFQRAKAAS